MPSPVFRDRIFCAQARAYRSISTSLADHNFTALVFLLTLKLCLGRSPGRDWSGRWWQCFRSASGAFRIVGLARISPSRRRGIGSLGRKACIPWHSSEDPSNLGSSCFMVSACEVVSILRILVLFRWHAYPSYKMTHRKYQWPWGHMLYEGFL